jgi:hypothetical protein
MLALVEAEMKCDYHLVSWFCIHFSMVSHWFWYLVGVRALFSNKIFWIHGLFPALSLFGFTKSELLKFCV